MIRTILTYPNELLTKVSEPVGNAEFNTAIDVDGSNPLVELCIDLAATMVHNNGIGIAAPQIGVLKRVIVMLVGGVMTPMINPVIEYSNMEVSDIKEGCLSVPGKELCVGRYSRVGISYQRFDGTVNTMELRDLEAVCVQHEIDHLNGILFHQK